MSDQNGSDGGIESVRLTDKIDVIALDGTDYPDAAVKRHSTVSVSVLQDALELVDTLGWETVDIITAHPDSDDLRVVALQPPSDSPLAGEQAAITVAPLTETGREKAASEDFGVEEFDGDLVTDGGTPSMDIGRATKPNTSDDDTTTTQVDLGGESLYAHYDRLHNTREDGERLLLLECPFCGKDWRDAYECGHHDHDDVKAHLEGHRHDQFFEVQPPYDTGRYAAESPNRRLVTDGGHPFDEIDRDGERIGEGWPNSRPQDGHTRRDTRLKRHADWQAGVLVGLACAALIGLLWRLLR